MKKLFIASAIAMMCLSANAFAEDDGYGNDIPAARSEGTVDDGYGNKLPSNEPEYKSFEEARSSSYGSPSKGSKKNDNQRTRFGLHLGIGFASLANYPTDKDFVRQYGENEWLGVSGDIGLIVKFPLNPILSFVPELNFGMTYLSEEIKGAGGDDEAVTGGLAVVVEPDVVGGLAEVGLDGHGSMELAAEALGLAAEVVHELVGIDTFGEAGEVLDFGGGGQLATGLEAFIQDGGEAGASGIDGSRVACGAAAEDEEGVVGHV